MTGYVNVLDARTKLLLLTHHVEMSFTVTERKCVIPTNVFVAIKIK